MFLKWSESVLKKGSSFGLVRLSDTPENTLVCLGKRQKVSREKIGTLSGHLLLEDVQVEILSRLPVKSVARFRCVCKLWNHLIHSKRFISLHLKNYRTLQLLVTTSCVMEARCSMYFLPPLPPTGRYSYNDVVASQKKVKDLFPELLCGSCNGIVCLYAQYSTTNIVLWNPATNESKSIPKSEFLLSMELSCYISVGFGFDPKTNDYKILQTVYAKHNSHVIQMELYSLRRDSWKKVDCHDFMIVPNVSAVDKACSLPFTDNRIVCSVVSPINKARKWEILSFDMSSETYEIIPVSPSLDNELQEPKLGRYRSRFFNIFPFKETIAVGIVYLVQDTSLYQCFSYCDIWMLNNFDSTNIQSRSWSKCFSTKVNNGYIMPIGCWGSSQILFQDRTCNGLCRLDLGKNIMVKLGVFQPSSLTPAVYKESFVRINDM